MGPHRKERFPILKKKTARRSLKSGASKELSSLVTGCYTRPLSSTRPVNAGRKDLMDCSFRCCAPRYQQDTHLSSSSLSTRKIHLWVENRLRWEQEMKYKKLFIFLFASSSRHVPLLDFSNLYFFFFPHWISMFGRLAIRCCVKRMTDWMKWLFKRQIHRCTYRASLFLIVERW